MKKYCFEFICSVAITRRASLMSSVFALAAFLLLAPAARAVVINVTEDFSASAAGWGDRDLNEMDVAWNGSAMQGDFDAGILTPETDAFQLTSGLGDLTQAGTYDLTSFTFNFFADTIAPSDVIFRFGDGVSTFFRAASVGFNSLSLASVAGWFGGSQAAFDAALSAATFLEVQVTRNGADAQTYRLDNFTLNGTLDNGGGGGPSAVPEPNTINLLAFIGMIGFALKRYRWNRANTATLESLAEKA